MLNPPVLYLCWLLHASTGTSEILISGTAGKLNMQTCKLLLEQFREGVHLVFNMHVLALHSPALEQLGGELKNTCIMKRTLS